MRPPTATRTAIGFTLFELIVALAILSILLAIAIPSFSTLIAERRLGSARSSLSGDFRTAKVNALSSGLSVVVCPRPEALPATGCGSDWTAGWLVYRDSGATSGALDTTDEVLRVTALHPGITMHVTGTRLGQSEPESVAGLVFDGRGRLDRHRVVATWCDGRLDTDPHPLSLSAYGTTRHLLPSETVWGETMSCRADS